MRSTKADDPRRRTGAGPRRRQPKPLAVLEDDLRRTAADVKRGLKRAGEAVERTRRRLEGEVRETADEMKRRIADARRVVAEKREKLKGEVRETAREVKRGVLRAKAVVRKTRVAVKKGRDRLEDEVRLTADEVKRAVADAKRRAKVTGAKLGDEARFIRTWIESPLTTGAVSPSGPDLARLMASYVDPHAPGPVVELGPGTGPVTEALIARGIPPERLLLVEYDPDFCKLLARRFVGATIVQGDAYALERTLGGRLGGPAAAVVSSLPLFTQPRAQRLALLAQAFRLMPPGAPFVQFTYAVVSPAPLDAGGFTATVSKRVWRNVPPARVWVYRSTATRAPRVAAPR